MLTALRSRITFHKQALLESFKVLLEKPLATSITVVVIALALALPTLFLILTYNLSEVTSDWKNGGHITIYLKNSLNQKQETQLLEKLKATRGVGQVSFKSAEEGLAELTKQDGMQDVMRYLSENPLPAVINITPAVTIDSPSKLDSLYKELQTFPEVDSAKLDMDWVNKLQAIFEFSSKAAHALMVLLALVVILIIGNTIRAAIFNSHEHIQVLKLVGATDSFIMRPFLYQGFWYGLIGAIIAIGLVNLFIFSLKFAVNKLAFAYKINYSLIGLSLSQILYLCLFASIIGWLGACLFVKKQLISIEP